jgi:short-subunit dehydrogenase
VLALALSLRAEAAEFGVKVSALIPAATTTELGKSMRKVSQGTDAHIKPYKGRPEITARLSSDEVAARALAGLTSNDAIIATHADMKPLVEDYCRRILAAYDAAAAFTG